MKQRMNSTVAADRQAHGMSQEKLAHEMGVTRETIRNIEKGTSIPNVFLAMLIAKRFGREVAEMFKELKQI